MRYFKYKNNELHCERVALSEIAKKIGTPFYVYSRNTLERHFRAVDSAFGKRNHLICYSMKANSNLAIGAVIARLGGGADIVSGGELYRALKAGFCPENVVYASVGKTREEIAFAIRKGILMFNVESLPELHAINEVAKLLGKKAGVSFRVNPNVDSHTHRYITTGKTENKFGLTIKDALRAYATAKTLPNVKILGVHMHIGSQITTMKPFVLSMRIMREFLDRLSAMGIEVRNVDIGGGLGIVYKEESPPDVREFAKTMCGIIPEKYRIIFEPGRLIVGNVGVLVTKVLYIKTTADKNFVIVDAGMNDLIRPTLYDAYHEINPVKKNHKTSMVADVVGPICESGDFFAKARRLPKVEPTEYLAIMSAGAYGFSMSSNYNSRPRVAEILVDRRKFRIVRRRENYTDLIKGEVT